MDETQGIVPASETFAARKPPRPAHPVFECALCVLGSLGSLYFPAIGTMAMVFGLWLLARKQESRAWLGIAGCLVPGIALSFASWVNFGSLVAPCIACALVIALLLPGRVRITSVVLTIAVLTGAMVLADASLVMMQGESFAAYVDALLAELRELTVASLGETASVALLAAVDQTVELMGKTWPLIYVARAAGVVVLGLFGLMLARRDTYQSAYDAFKRYDMPLWGVVALIAALALMACEALGVGSAAMGAAGLDILFCLRVLFFLQGVAVAMALMDRRGWSPVARVLAIAAMLMAEAGLYAVCVFGVIDVWANFRHLERRKRTGGGSKPCGEGE